MLNTYKPQKTEDLRCGNGSSNTAEQDPPVTTNQNGTNTHCDRVIYARTENDVKTPHAFVWEIPKFLDYLKADNSKRGPNDLIERSSPEFYDDGVWAKMQIQEELLTYGPSYQIEYQICLREHDVDFNYFDISIQALVCDGQNEIEVASEVEPSVKGNVELSYHGIGPEIEQSKILKKVPNGATDTTFRIVLNVKAFFYKRAQPHRRFIGVDDQHDPPFLKPIQNGNDADVELACEGNTFPVHALVLKNVSHVFRRMFEAPMKEAAMRRIEIEDISADTTKSMLDYIYYGRISIGSDAQVFDLLYAAEKYEFDLLKTACLQHMVASKSDENITTFLKISIGVSADDEIIKPMVAYCLARVVELLKREDFRVFAQENPTLFFGTSTSD